MLNNKVVIVTGGSKGLGYEIVKLFLHNGAKVAFTYRSENDDILKLCKEFDGNIYGIKADASDYEKALEVVDLVIKKFGKVDILVNNAASAIHQSIIDSDFDSFEYTIKNTLYPVYNYSKAISSHFIDNCAGKIINIGSINGMRGREGSSAYCAAKAGIEGFTKTLAKELGRFNVCCNVIAPGFIDTKSQKSTSALIKKLVYDECAIKHLSTPEEVSELVIFLASDKANCITGTVIKIDNGQYV